MDAKTHETLLAAMHGEAFAFARYKLFADAARAGGDERVASMFDGMANVELHEHFVELAELAGIVGADADNIAAALQDENDEIHTTYPEFARRARMAGEEAVALRFEEIIGDERAHAEALEGELEKIEAPA